VRILHKTTQNVYKTIKLFNRYNYLSYKIIYFHEYYNIYIMNIKDV
jgi:hypothetical protein